MSIQLKRKYKNWQPQKNLVIRNQSTAEKIHLDGFEKISFIPQQVIDELKALFDKEHQFEVEKGGMFYSLYSRDKAYRKRVHEQIHFILKPYLEKHFVNYRNVINSFVVKLPGEKSEFYLHQDTTALDEFQYSPLSIWIPLQEINEQNGALTLIEKTHWFFSPFRGVSFAFPFKNISQHIKKYLQPIFMKAGEALFFDNRLIHNSMENKSNQARIAIVCGIFPAEAEFRTCYKDPELENSPIEIYEHDRNYLIEYPHFFYNCTNRPISGTKVDEINELFPEMKEQEFDELCQLNDIPVREKIDTVDANTVNCQLIAEPDGINRFEEQPEEKATWFKRLFKLT